MKKLLSILLVIAMLTAFAIPAIATETTAEPSTGTEYDIQITSDIVIDEKIHDAEGRYPWNEYGKLDAIVAGKEYKRITVREFISAVWDIYGNCGFSCQDNQDENSWTVGSTHELNIRFVKWSESGEETVLFATSVNVTVQETNIESISVNPITIYEGGFVDTYGPAVITYKDGSTENAPMHFRDEWPTEIGTYERTAYVYDCIEVPVTIHVVPFPVDIQITSDIVIDEKIHNTEGNYPWESYGKLDAIIAGKEFKGITVNEFRDAIYEAYNDGGIMMPIDDQYMNPWTVGSTHECSLSIYKVEGSIFFATYVNVTVQETSIESITAEPITIYEGGLEIKDEYFAIVTYKDGSTEKVPMDYWGDRPTEIGTYEGTGYVYGCIEIPVTVHVVARPDASQDEITVEDGVATVPDSAVEVTEGEDVVIDVTGTEEKADSVVIGAETVDKIADAEAPVEVKLPDASVSFDKTAIDSVNQQAGESPVTIVAKKVAESALNAQQTAALDKTKVCAVLTVEAYAGKTKITDFGGGKVTISIPFALPEGKEGKDFYVAYVADDGTVTAMPTTYADGKLTFETTHFSSYVVVDKSAAAEAVPGNPQTGDSSHILLFTALMVVSATALAVCATKRRAF